MGHGLDLVAAFCVQTLYPPNASQYSVAGLIRVNPSLVGYDGVRIQIHDDYGSDITYACNYAGKSESNEYQIWTFVTNPIAGSQRAFNIYNANTGQYDLSNGELYRISASNAIAHNPDLTWYLASNIYVAFYKQTIIFFLGQSTSSSDDTVQVYQDVNPQLTSWTHTAVDITAANNSAGIVIHLNHVYRPLACWAGIPSKTGLGTEPGSYLSFVLVNQIAPSPNSSGYFVVPS